MNENRISNLHGAKQRFPRCHCCASSLQSFFASSFEAPRWQDLPKKGYTTFMCGLLAIAGSWTIICFLFCLQTLCRPTQFAACSALTVNPSHRCRAKYKPSRYSTVPPYSRPEQDTMVKLIRCATRRTIFRQQRQVNEQTLVPAHSSSSPFQVEFLCTSTLCVVASGAFWIFFAKNAKTSDIGLERHLENGAQLVA
ncbi:hypothetical protein B0H11DRAFT_833660 [Mycena galericulata]|nr:hypothetical protein B0H11DRAFT_833660 [Mycena galericulata]